MMPIAKFQMPDGRIAKFEVPEGTTPEQAQAQIQSMIGGGLSELPPSSAMPEEQLVLPKSQTISEEWAQATQVPFGERLGRIAADIPRAGGVALRNILEGGLGAIEFLGTPLMAAMQTAGMDVRPGAGERLATAMGLPQPQGPTERLLSGAEKVIAGGAGPLAIAQKAAPISQIAATMAARPAAQLQSMTGAGLLGEYAKEKGGGPWAQLGASLAGGILAPTTISAGQKAVQLGKSAVRSMRQSPNLNLKIDTTITQAMESGGIDAGSVSDNVKRQLREDMKKALDKGEMSPDIVRRLVDYRLTGTTPTAGPLTLDPGVITRQKNLAALGASSKDPKLQALSQVAHGNVRKLTEQLNSLGASSTDDAYAAGTKMIDSLENVIAKKKSAIDPLWKAAKTEQGKSAQLDPSFFTRRADDLLQEELLQGSLPSDVRNLLNGIAKGETPLTVAVSEQLKTRLFNLQKPLPKFGQEGQTKNAINTVRRALEETPLLQAQGANALKAFNNARAASREWLQTVERTPALQAVREGVEPDKFMQTFIIGAGKPASMKAVRNLKTAIKNDPEAIGVVKNYVARFLKDKAMGGAADEIGKFSQSAYNKALTSIGNHKLKLFFEPEEINMLKAIGRVASYEQAQPIGSAVNNSNTAAAAVAGMLDAVGTSQILRRIPFGAQLISDPAKTISQNIEASQFMKPSITQAVPTVSAGKIAPMIGIGAAQEQ